MATVTQTRFKYGMIYVVVVFVEACVTAFFPAFPFAIAIGAQGAALGFYTFSQTSTDNTFTRMNGKNHAPVPRDPD